MVIVMQVCQNILSMWTSPFFNEIRAFKSLTKAGMDNNVASSF